MHLFIATTPYNIFNIIRTKITKFSTISANIYISDFSSQNKVIAENLAKCGIFENVYYVKHGSESVQHLGGKSVFARFISKLKHTLFYNSQYRKLCGNVDENTSYEHIFIDVANLMQRVVHNHFKQINERMAISLIDVGLESYIFAENITDVIKGKIYRDFDKLYLNGASFFTRDGVKSDIKSISQCNIDIKCNSEIKSITQCDNAIVSRIEPISATLSAENIALINSCFNYNNVDMASEDILLFDQLFEINQENFIFDAIAICQQFYPDMAVKLHPRRTDTSRFDASNIKLIKGNSSYELSLINGDYRESQMLITVHSMAVALPKMIVNKEPYILLLCKLNPYKTSDDGAIIEFMNKLKASYSDKSKVMMPETIDELKLALGNMKKTRENKSLS